MKSFEKLRNRLVIFLKIKEQESEEITEQYIFLSSIIHFRMYFDLDVGKSSK